MYHFSKATVGCLFAIGFTMFDIIIRNGQVVDGSGLPWVRADVAILGDKIAAVGQLTGAMARQELDATDKVVAPGFVDAHVHGDLPLLTNPDMEACVQQGVTTLIVGQDGVAFSCGPREVLEYMHDYTAGFNGRIDPDEFTWNNVAGYLDRLNGQAAINAATLIPNGNIRMAVMGLDPRPATPVELRAMRRLVREGMEQGAVGLSSGLDYIPSLYADEDELVALCEEIAPYGGVYVTHMRGYNPVKFPAAMQEVLNIAKRAQCAVHVSHFNVLAEQALPVVDTARKHGLDVTYDLYCYLYGSTILAMLALPPEMCVGGMAATIERLHDAQVRRELEATFAQPRFPLETIRLANVSHPDWRFSEGMLLTHAVAETGLSMVDFVCDMLIATKLEAACVIRHFAERQESDTRALMQHPAMMAGSDGIYAGGNPHPRGTGCFAKYLGEYVRNGTWTLETAVRHLAYHPARRHGLADRGLLVPGFAADVVVFDADAINPTSTYENGKSLAVGMEQVIVNGELVYHAGKMTTARPGRELKRMGTG
jgi:N-acyl-D-amino-acid deacylase